VAYEVRQGLYMRHSIFFLVRKLGVPGHEEFGRWAQFLQDGVSVLNVDVVVSTWKCPETGHRMQSPHLELRELEVVATSPIAAIVPSTARAGQKPASL
jgi:predicted phosphoribosyltransferase